MTQAMVDFVKQLKRPLSDELSLEPTKKEKKEKDKKVAKIAKKLSWSPDDLPELPPVSWCVNNLPSEGKEKKSLWLREIRKRKIIILRQGILTLKYCFWNILIKEIRSAVVVYSQSLCLGCRRSLWYEHTLCEDKIVDVWRRSAGHILRQVNLKTEDLEMQWEHVLKLQHVNPVFYPRTDPYSPSPHKLTRMWNHQVEYKLITLPEILPGLEFHSTIVAQQFPFFASQSQKLFEELNRRFECFVSEFLVCDMFFGK